MPVSSSSTNKFPLVKKYNGMVYLICMKRNIIVRTNPFISIIIGIVCVFALIFGAFLYGKSTNSQSIATLKEQHDLIIKNEVFTAISLLKIHA